MQNTKSALSLAASLGFASLCLSACATMSTGNKPTSQIHVTSSDRVFLRLVPLDSVVGVELSRAGLDATKTHDALLSEFHYQLFLKKQEEAQDSAGSTVRVTVTIQHLQSGSGNSGSF
ncbi:MAG TPA: hypothetical protein DCQ83_02750, partial [Fibrobacteres bacterium]|nr:hypothetical protein [Fibrobacterota bacterium]